MLSAFAINLAMKLTLFPPQIPPRAKLSLSGSKSFTNRALVLAALAPDDSVLLNPSRSEDSLTLLNLLHHFGVESQWREDGALRIHSVPENLSFVGELDVGPAGTVMRFMTAFAASSAGTDVVLKGTERMHQRPIGALVDALRSLGAEIQYLDQEGYPPLRVQGRKLAGGSVVVDGSLSSQFLTALLLVGARFEEGLELSPRGELVSQSYLRMTCQTLRAFGVDVVEKKGGVFSVRSQNVEGTEYLVEADASGASYLWGVAAITGGEVTLGPFGEDSLQGDIQFPKLLEQMGCEVVSSSNESSITVRGPSGRLKATSANMSEMPDSAQTLAVLAAVADGVSTLTGLSTLRVKETNRIDALQTELGKLGVEVDATTDSILIRGIDPADLKNGTIATYDDHRMAMSFSLLSAVLPELTIENPDVVSKSFPDYWERLRVLGIKSSRTGTRS